MINEKSVKVYTTLVIMLLISLVLSYEHYPPSIEGLGKWLQMTFSIMSGFILFTFVCLFHGVILEVLPIILIGLLIPFLMFYFFLKKKKSWLLYLGAFVWIVEGYMATIGAYF